MASTEIPGEIHFAIFHRPGPAWDADREATEQDGIAEHFAYLSGLAETRTVILGGPFLAPGVGGLLVTRTGLDATEAREIAENDPAVKRGLITAEVWPWFVTIDVSRASPAAIR